MDNVRRIRSALISVYHKDNLEPIVKKLDSLDISLFSTGGTKKFIENIGVKVTAVEEVTDYPSILGGRVKTLHPKIFGGILYRRDNDDDINQIKDYDIPGIDLVIVDLYPFEETVASGLPEQDIIEKIDIGGISLIRAAAKNYRDTLIVPSQAQYKPLMELLESKNGESSLQDRQIFALHAFDVSSNYDTAIFNHFNRNKLSDSIKFSYQEGHELRYGENPHQEGVFYGNFEDVFDQLHGKQISYNNLLDIDAAVNLIAEFDDTTVAILKHNNACGIASRDQLVSAWKDALAGDPVSAFGGIIIMNTKVDEETAKEMDKIFFEVCIAPCYDSIALEILKHKKNRIILVQKVKEFPKKQVRSILNGLLVQDRDIKMERESDLQVVTKAKPSQEEIRDLLFANKVVKHSKSNTIVLAKGNQLIASGIGQTSRVDALKQAIDKARYFNFDLKGAVMASDAFFPFADSVEIANKAGINSVIQPGGSKRDHESIEFCDKNGISMLFTGTRHFKH